MSSADRANGGMGVLATKPKSHDFAYEVRSRVAVSMFRWSIAISALLAFSQSAAAQQAAESASKTKSEVAEEIFNRRVEGFLNQYCVACHRGAMPEAKLNLE